MFFAENLKKKNILLNIQSANRWDLIKEIVNILVKNKEIPENEEENVANLLINREKSISTGIGNGIAIPHSSLSFINSPIIFMAISKKGINFESIDNKFVNIIIVLLVPKNKLSQHIKTMTTIARIINNNELKTKLLNFDTTDALYKYLENYDPGKN